MNISIASFYKFQELSNFYDMREPLLQKCHQLGIKGTVILAEEGINATIAGCAEGVKDFFAFLGTDSRLAEINYTLTCAQFLPFKKMKVRLKREIVTLIEQDLDINCAGKYIDPADWDNFINRSDVLLIDTRNTYEIAMGTFKGAINPHTEYFRDFPKWARNWSVDKLYGKEKIAMFCTGGIRCEKSTALMKKLGFEDVYHLKGGILQYLQETGNKNSAWSGECFIFDDRVALAENASPMRGIMCSSCGKDLDGDSRSMTRGRVVCSRCIHHHEY